MSINVLIVDDSRIMRTMILKTLQMTGISLGEVFQAGNGREGLESLEQNWIDLAIVDINMPVMNGEEMIDRMRANPEMKDLPAVVVSTEGSETRIARLEAKGAVFIHKPFQAETIRDTIVDLLKLEIGDE
ncbi:MAG: two-component system response regulator [Desulfobacteraceae bacterium 4572_87]|nr:MAG: two-component system response regulator [Desulfobacteraceae bacterium 4572_87]